LEKNHKRIDLYNMDIYKDYPHMQAVAKRIKKHEGFKLNTYNLAYNDVDGKYIKEDFKTGGYGHRMLEGEVAPDTKEGWEQIFEQDFRKSFESASKLVDKDNIDPVALGIITEMVYQMGSEGVSKFKNTLKLINNKDYSGASTEMLDSKWAKQTPDRAVRLSNLMLSISN
jgi:lysozyme